MATKKDAPQALAVETAPVTLEVARKTDADNAALGPAPDEKQEVSKAVMPSLPPARRTVPTAPKATTPAGGATIARIREILTGAMFRTEPDAIPAAVETIEAVPTLQLHPSVASYKAEVLDYLRGRFEQQSAFADQLAEAAAA